MLTNEADADVKSCGPGAPVLALMRDDASHHAQTGAREPVPGESTYKR